VSKEPNILEQISTARRTAETWSRNTEIFVRRTRRPLEAGSLKLKAARNGMEMLARLADEGSSCYEDLDKLLNAVSR
jgi:hypothetical protein